MSRFPFFGRVVLLFSVAAIPFCGPAVLSAAEPAAPSLKIVPADAAYYSASLRLGEQIDIVAKSNWWKRITETDYAQQAKAAWEEGKDDPNNPLGQFLPILELPENQQALAVLKDMASEEIFTYGSSELTELLVLFNELSKAVNKSNAEAAVEGGEPDEEQLARAALDHLSENLDQIKVPEFVCGFKITKQKPATEQLARIEAYARVMIEQVEELEPLRGKLKRAKIGGGDYVTLELDGSLIPWDEIPIQDIEEEEGQYDKVMEKLKSLKIVFSMGIRGDYLLVSFAGSNDHLATLGEGESLADVAALAPLRARGEQRYTGISYVSDTLMKAAGSKPEDIDYYVLLARQLMPESGLEEKDQQAILADIEALAKDLKPYVPEPGAYLTYSFLTKRGYESYQHNRTKNNILDASKPLSLLDHVGGSPILAVVARSQYRPQDYALLSKWGKKVKGHFERIALPQLSDDEREQYDQVAEIAWPALAKADKVTSDMLIPSTEDGQFAFVLDAKLTSKQWHQALPPTHKECPIVQPAIVIGLSDADMFKKALGEYRAIANDVIKQVKPLAPPDAPLEQLPAAKSRESSGGLTVYYYPFPREFGLDGKLALNGGINKELAAFTISPRHTLELAKKQPLEISGGPLAAHANKPVAAAVYFNWSALVDASLPWVEEGVRYYVAEMEGALKAAFDEEDADAEPAGDSELTKEMLKQANLAAEFLKVLRTYSSVTYVENDGLVTHSELHLKDLE